MNLFFPVSWALPLKKRFMNDFIKNMLVTGSDFISLYHSSVLNVFISPAPSLTYPCFWAGLVSLIDWLSTFWEGSSSRGFRASFMRCFFKLLVWRRIHPKPFLLEIPDVFQRKSLTRKLGYLVKILKNFLGRHLLFLSSIFPLQIFFIFFFYFEKEFRKSF